MTSGAAERPTSHAASRRSAAAGGEQVHGRAGERADPGRLTADRSVHALLKNLYDAELVRAGDGPAWVMRRVVIDNVWLTGDPAAIFG
ncbi:hypothetical protein BKA00_001880 [Actinomadura coerulea]|uniref:Uncharacterized protein n=1 Tax=Actinomadura coerulea TaxID=46159 RepID=A0A7X0KY34_9ACTN|nr:hypothetical protein [Actinomadura coerulea]MBB6394966.1 hypothetical protein [Actinomadura coerulea]GGQ13871.1 hypothetical protein GCM10010187_32530 [Actinomadura coerulea]